MARSDDEWLSAVVFFLILVIIMVGIAIRYGWRAY